MKSLFFIVIFGFSCASSLLAQDDWHTYPFRDLASVVAGEQALYDKTAKADIVVSAKPFPSKTRVIYTGQKRPVSELGVSFIKIWAETRNVPASVDFLLEEFLFLERGKQYWMPVHKGTAQAIAKNLDPGSEVVIYYFYLGGFDARSLHSKHETLKEVENREPDGIRWILAVERVEKPGSEFPLIQIEDIINKSSHNDISDAWVDSRQIKAKIKAVFTGKFRDVTGKRQEVRDVWLAKQNASGASRLMQTEGLFKIDGKEYWIIMRNQTREHLISFVKKGDSVFLNTILTGAVKSSNKIDWVFASGEYSTF
jgi:hypothetical protein